MGQPKMTGKQVRLKRIHDQHGHRILGTILDYAGGAKSRELTRKRGEKQGAVAKSAAAERSSDLGPEATDENG